ncbi:MAG: cyclase family protein [Firmicutes bacterium]|nr:cyclase family protein [Bacillota bacterium]
MVKLIDLSHPMTGDMPVLPGDAEVGLVQCRNITDDGYNAFRLTTMLHVGTHLDAPLHFIAGGKMVHSIPLETFIGPGCLLDVRDEASIDYKKEYDEVIKQGDIVLLYTGWSEVYGKKEYYTEHPVVSEELADVFVRRKIKMLGMDVPSPDRAPFPIHHQLLGENIPIVENLTNLGELKDLGNFDIMAFPIKIMAEGCPVRVVARSG